MCKRLKQTCQTPSVEPVCQVPTRICFFPRSHVPPRPPRRLSQWGSESHVQIGQVQSPRPRSGALRSGPPTKPPFCTGTVEARTTPGRWNGGGGRCVRRRRWETDTPIVESSTRILVLSMKLMTTSGRERRMASRSCLSLTRLFHNASRRPEETFITPRPTRLNRRMKRIEVFVGASQRHKRDVMNHARPNGSPSRPLPVQPPPAPNVEMTSVIRIDEAREDDS
jgi:hypothetical protein